MKRFPFRLDHEDSLILLDCKVGLGNFALALDTGASHTVIDITPLLMIGIDVSRPVRKVEFETANGVVNAKVFVVPKFSALGHSVYDFEICAYDFLANGIVSEFDGMLGLDFLIGKDLFISFKRFEISLL